MSRWDSEKAESLDLARVGPAVPRIVGVFNLRIHQIPWDVRGGCKVVS